MEYSILYTSTSYQHFTYEDNEAQKNKCYVQVLKVFKKKSRSANLGNLTSEHWFYKEILMTKIAFKILKDLTIVNLFTFNNKFEIQRKLNKNTRECDKSIHNTQKSIHQEKKRQQRILMRQFTSLMFDRFARVS